MKPQIKHWICSVPPTVQMSSYKTNCRASNLESKEQNALWDYNSARAHDGLSPLPRMPTGTTYKAVYEDN